MQVNHSMKVFGTAIFLSALVLGVWPAQQGYAQRDGVDFSAEPHALVTEISDTLFQSINANRADYRANPDQLDELVEDVFIPVLDRDFSARLILGKHGRGLSPAKIEAFGEALLDQLVSRYSDGLLEFDSRDQVKVLPLVGKNTERQTRVRTRIQLNDGDEAPVDYVLRKTEAGWKAFDVIIEGISYVATYRNQFGEEISKDGFDKVLSRLQSGALKLDKGKSDQG